MNQNKMHAVIASIENEHLAKAMMKQWHFHLQKLEQRLRLMMKQLADEILFERVNIMYEYRRRT